MMRNLAVALGDAPAADHIIAALEARLPQASALVQEHIHWALAEQRKSKEGSSLNLLQKKLTMANKLNAYY